MTLIGVVVLQTVIGVVFGHACAFESPAIARASRLAESILVMKGAPIHQLVLTALPHQADLLLRQGQRLDFVFQFLLREKGESVYGGWRNRPAQSWTKLCVSCNNVDMGFVHKQIIGWSGPIVFPHDLQSLIGLSEILDSTRGKADPGAQLLVFLVRHDGQLILAGFDLLPTVTRLERASYQQATSQNDIRSDANGQSYFEPKLNALAICALFLVFVIFFGKGFKSFVYSGRFLGGATMMLAGWLAGVAAVWVFVASIIGHSVWLFTENVSAASGIDASARCYGSWQTAHTAEPTSRFPALVIDCN
jgi:hypothetical protein